MHLDAHYHIDISTIIHCPHLVFFVRYTYWYGVSAVWSQYDILLFRVVWVECTWLSQCHQHLPLQHHTQLGVQISFMGLEKYVSSIRPPKDNFLFLGHISSKKLRNWGIFLNFYCTCTKFLWSRHFFYLIQSQCIIRLLGPFVNRNSSTRPKCQKTPSFNSK